MDKLISVIVPCYNVERYLERCVQSLVSQTIGIDVLEIILIDDCSTDSTWNILVDIERRYPDSICIVHCDENGRQGRARNIGLSYASAPYICYVDSDDWIEMDMFAKMYEKIVEHDCDIVKCNSWRDMDSNDQKLPAKRDANACDRLINIDSEEKRKILIAENQLDFSVWNKLYRTKFLKDNGIDFPEGLAYEDHYFSMLLHLYVKKIYFLDERLYHYFVNMNSTVMSANALHHFDILSVDIMMWDECERRGFIDKYREELEYQLLSLCYMTSIKMLLLRHGKVPYDFLCKMKQEIMSRIGDYERNRYIGRYTTDIYKVMLEILNREISESECERLFAELSILAKSGKIRL